MDNITVRKGKKFVLPNDIVQVGVFQNKNNKQFNLPVMKRHTSPQIINDILNDRNVIGLKFKITDVIFRNNKKGVNLNKV